MKIPETSANVGAYYGNEENGQWQPNGVIIDNGVGGGVVGSGDAGIHRPPVYPVHIPRGVPAGYVMAGAYYPPAFPPVAAPTPDDFADYMWMENEEEFDKQVLQQLEEEALMEQCIEAMLEDEQRERQRGHPRPHTHNYPTTSNGNPSVSLEEAVSKSKLNPLAAEFVPTRVRQPPAPTENKQPPPQTEAPSAVEQSRTGTDNKVDDTTESTPQVTDDTKTEEAATPPKDPPEVSAADIQPIKTIKKEKDIKKPDVKKAPKIDSKKPKPVTKEAKPIVVRSETKIAPKKKEVKSVKSEIQVEGKSEEVVVPVDVPKPVTPPVSEEQTPTFKPINYAAAAKATKPKAKSTTPPVETKPTPPITKPDRKPEPPKVVEKIKSVTEKKLLPKEKSIPKEKVNVQRKNSTNDDVVEDGSTLGLEWTGSQGEL